MAADVPLISYRKVVGGSERSFGITFAVVLTVVAFWPAPKGIGGD